MAKFKRFTTADGGYHGELGFYCPGCKYVHFICDKETNSPGMPVWEFNNDFEKPTISPSLLVRSKYAGLDTICHSFIKDGMIQYLSDCTHCLKGQTVELSSIKNT